MHTCRACKLTAVKYHPQIKTKAVSAKGPRMHYSTFLRNLSGVQKASPEARSAAGCCFLTDCFSQSLGTLCAQPGHLLLPTYRQDQLVCGTQFHVVQSCIKATCRPSSLKIILVPPPKVELILNFIARNTHKILPHLHTNAGPFNFQKQCELNVIVFFLLSVPALSPIRGTHK